MADENYGLSLNPDVVVDGAVDTSATVAVDLASVARTPSDRRNGGLAVPI